jgi:hypothetical protein
VQHHVFLSYSRKDNSIMQQVRDDLRAVGLRVWTDDALETGNKTQKVSIERILKDAGCVVAILSPDAINTASVLKQMELADAHDKQVFLILARGEPGEVIPSGYSSQQWIDIRHKAHHEPQMRQLIQTIREYVEDESRTIPTPFKLTTGTHPVISSPTNPSEPGGRRMRLVLLIILAVVALVAVWLFALGGWAMLAGT